MGRFGAGEYGVGEWSITVSWDGTAHPALDLVHEVCETWRSFFREHSAPDDKSAA